MQLTSLRRTSIIRLSQLSVSPPEADYLALNFEYEYEDDDEYEAEDMLPNIVLVLDYGIFEMPTHVYFKTDNQIR